MTRPLEQITQKELSDALRHWAGTNRPAGAPSKNRKDHAVPAPRTLAGQRSNLNISKGKSMQAALNQNSRHGDHGIWLWTSPRANRILT